VNAIIELKNIEVYSTDYRVLKDISISIPANQFTVIIGPSGCGKSTLLKVIAGILIPDQGEVLVEGSNIHLVPEKKLLELKKKNGFVFQDSALWSNKSIFENFELPLHFHYPELTPPMIAEKIRFALEEINLLDSIYLRPAQLSIGEQKMVSFMRALITEPTLLFLDEPTTSIDRTMRKKIISTLIKKKNNKATTVAVTNDADIISLLTDHLVVLKDGVVLQTGPINEVKMSTYASVQEILADGVIPQSMPKTDFTDPLSGINGTNNH
jgi:phospholipid/cholesterol/gamma-HCH transport system ATP-binding protein